MKQMKTTLNLYSAKALCNDSFRSINKKKETTTEMIKENNH